jgi:hypothetical protein
VTETLIHTEQPAQHRRPPVLLLVGAVALVQMALVLLFAWSASRAAPHDLPLVVAGPPQVAQQVAAGIDAAAPGAFAVTVVADDAAARAAVTGRDAYGGVVLGQRGSTVYVATGASAAVAQVLSQQLPAALAKAAPGAPVTVTDLAPAPPDDPRGAGLPTALIPLTITSIAAGALVGLLGRTRRERLLAVAAYSLVAGIVCALSMQTILGVLGGSWWGNAGVLTLAALATSAATAGLAAVLGIAGVGVSAALIFFFGFPFSGAASAWQLVPTPWGRLAQFLPVGATNTGLRAVAFFDGAAAAGPLSVLAGWAVVGLVLVAVGARGLSATNSHPPA